MEKPVLCRDFQYYAVAQTRPYIPVTAGSNIIKGSPTRFTQPKSFKKHVLPLTTFFTLWKNDCRIRSAGPLGRSATGCFVMLHANMLCTEETMIWFRSSFLRKMQRSCYVYILHIHVHAQLHLRTTHFLYCFLKYLLPCRLSYFCLRRQKQNYCVCLCADY